MADTGKLEHTTRGGRLRLFGADGETRRVVAGPRREFPEQGEVRVYGDGKLLSKLDVTAANEGRLSLRVDNGGERPVETVLLQAGADDDPRPRARLVLRDAETGDQIVLGFDDNGPYVMLHRGFDHMKVALSEMRALPVRGEQGEV